MLHPVASNWVKPLGKAKNPLEGLHIPGGLERLGIPQVELKSFADEKEAWSRLLSPAANPSSEAEEHGWNSKE